MNILIGENGYFFFNFVYWLLQLALTHELFFFHVLQNIGNQLEKMREKKTCTYQFDKEHEHQTTSTFLNLVPLA